MEIKSYNILYLDDVSTSIGIMFEQANNLNINPVIFWNTFINSNVAKEIEKGNPKYLNSSGLDYLNEIYKDKKRISKKENIKRNQYYWAGWALTKLQYKTNYSFYKINEYLPIEEVLRLYPTLHEANISKFFDVALTYFKKDHITNLKKIREAKGISQNELSKLANVDIRSIQMYEQRRNDINKAQTITLYRLAKVLGCNVEDLLEF